MPDTAEVNRTENSARQAAYATGELGVTESDAPAPSALEGSAFPWGSGPSQQQPCGPGHTHGYCPPGYICISGQCSPWDQHRLETGYGPGGQITTNPPPTWNTKFRLG